MIAFDAYEIRARFAPSLIIVSPLALVVVGLSRSMTSAFLTTSTLVFIALLYAFSFLVRQLGLKRESSLWNSWGGPPSALIIQEGDTTFSKDTKASIHEAIVKTFNISDKEPHTFIEDPNRTQEIFRLVRQRIRQNDPKGLWFTHNAEYGFLRNLLGSWLLLLTNSLLSSGVCGFLWHLRGDKNLVVLGIICAGIGLAAILGRVFVLPSAVRTAAWRYAESAWTSFLSIYQTGKTEKQGDGR